MSNELTTHPRKTSSYLQHILFWFLFSIVVLAAYRYIFVEVAYKLFYEPDVNPFIVLVRKLHIPDGYSSWRKLIQAQLFLFFLMMCAFIPAYLFATFLQYAPKKRLIIALVLSFLLIVPMTVLVILQHSH